ncbi:MAG: SDR family oxidoreductase [Rhodospirillales bacterium]|nr:SDR family oxidoreductase [Rhodospirillales bacterium]
MRTILITGGGGYIGRELIKRLSEEAGDGFRIVAADVREVPEQDRLPEAEYETADIRDHGFKELVQQVQPHVVVHLASIVSAGGDPEFEHSVDVLGTKNVLDSCLAAEVEQIIVTSSGAAYGYHADSPEWLNEDHLLRGNEDFAYSRHKRMVEELLADYRQKHPELKQLIFRPGSVIGENVNNQITALFERPFILGIAGSDCSFVFIWDRDVVSCMAKGILESKEGVYNLAGDGAMPMREIAKVLGKPYLSLPASFVGTVLGGVRALGLGKLGPEHVKFLQYRPVLNNAKLKTEFGITLEKTSREAFELFRKARFGGEG